MSIRNWAQRIRHPADYRETAIQWLMSAIASWEMAGRISGVEAAALRDEVETPSVQIVLLHLGAHLAISTVLWFPFASLTRAGWTAWALSVATVRFLRGRIDREAWVQAWRIHHPIVILVALIPGIGIFAYLVSAPMRSNQLLARIAFDAVMVRLPWRLYERSGLRRAVVAARRGAPV